MSMIKGRDVEDLVLKVVDLPTLVSTGDHTIVLTYNRPVDRDDAMRLLRRLRGGNPADG